MNDSIGPEKVIRVSDPSLGMEGILVLDNTALGVGKGGIRMTSTVNEDELRRLARAMTLKNALAGIPFGGAKSGIIIDPKKISLDKKKEIVESFSRELKRFVPSRYIAAPDMNMASREMAWFAAANGSWDAATGKPSNFCLSTQVGDGEKCGLPHELGSTGFGVAQATRVASSFLGVRLDGMTVAVAGFGNVGQFAARHLVKMGARLIAASDSGGTTFNSSGLDPEMLIALKNDKKSVTEYLDGDKINGGKIYALPVDILIPAAGTDVIGDGNLKDISAKIIVEGANIPMRSRHEEDLASRGVLVVPDIIANAGGVISSYAEYKGYKEGEMFSLVKDKIINNVDIVLRRAKDEGISPRRASLDIAYERIRSASIA